MTLVLTNVSLMWMEVIVRNVQWLIPEQRNMVETTMLSPFRDATKYQDDKKEVKTKK